MVVEDFMSDILQDVNTGDRGYPCIHLLYCKSELLFGYPAALHLLSCYTVF